MREGWTYKKLGDYIKEYSVKNKAGKDIPVYSVTNSQGFCKEYFSKEIASQDKTSYKIVPYGFFAFNPSRINVGSIDWQHKEEQVIVSPLYNVFSVSESVLQPYLLYYLKSPATIKYIDAIATGTVRLNLKLSMLKDFSIPVPSLSEQQSIVAELDKINELISLKKAQLSDLDSLAQSIFYDMFGDPIENEKGWEVKKLEGLVKIIGGYAFKSSDFQENGIPVLRIGNINSGEFKPINMVFWKKDVNLSRYSILPGDMVISLTGTVGKSDYGNICILDNSYEEYYLNQRNAKLEILEKLDKYYLSKVLKFDSIKSKLTNISRGVRQANISNKDIENLQIPLPPLPLQQEFAKRIELIEQQKAQISSTIKDLETLLASRMQYWFD